jgi:hypothetical protein
MLRNSAQVVRRLRCARRCPVLSSSIVIQRVHVTDLRTALDAARTALSLSPMSYTDSTITSYSTIIKAAHINDLRQGVK